MRSSLHKHWQWQREIIIIAFENLLCQNSLKEN